MAITLNDLINYASPSVGAFPMAATQAGVGRTDMSQLTNPDLSVMLGTFSPGDLQTYIDAQQQRALQQAINDYNTQRAEIENASIPLASVRPNTIEYDSLMSDPYFSLLIGDVVDNVMSGSLDPEAAVESLALNRASSNDLRTQFASKILSNMAESGMDVSTPEMQDRAERRANSIIEQFGLGNKTFAEALGLDPRALQTRFERIADEGRAVREWGTTSGMTPEREQGLSLQQRQLSDLGSLEDYVARNYDPTATRLKMFSDLGVPGLALAPDPGEQYKFDVNDLQKYTGRVGIEKDFSKLVSGLEKRQKEAGLVGIGADVPGAKVPRTQAWESAVGRQQRDMQILLDAMSNNAARQGRTPYQDWQRSMLEYAVTEAQ